MMLVLPWSKVSAPELLLSRVSTTSLWLLLPLLLLPLALMAHAALPLQPSSWLLVLERGGGAGLVTVAVGTVVGVGGAGYVVAVAEARGQRDVNDVGDALSSVVEVGWVCWILTLIEGEGAAAAHLALA